MHAQADIQKTPRTFLPEQFSLETFETLKPYLDQLELRDLRKLSDLEQWLRDWSEVQGAVSEDGCWRQIRMTCDTANPALEESFNRFCLDVEPPLRPYTDRLNRKLLACPFRAELDPAQYGTLLRSVEKEVRLFREENIPLQADLNILAQQYGQITGAMSIEVEGNEYTLQQAARFLMQSDRTLRETVYHKVQDRRIRDEKALDDLFDQLLQKRHRMALNAGFENYRDYRFEELGRFDYGTDACFDFHEAVRVHMLPLVEQLYTLKQKELGVDSLRPWDTDAEPEGRKPLEPFRNGRELLDKSIEVFSRLRPLFGDCLRKMDQLGHFDLESRKGKAPGGYNCPLAETGAPFIFMNAAGTADDVVTMMHEGGHALHSFFSHPLPLQTFKEYPMEMAELASMSMELFTMGLWDHFYADADELRRARFEVLERALSIFPWIAIIDRFQHWLYTHPGHSHADRRNAWLDIHRTYSPANLNWDGLEAYRSMLWQKQLHLFEVPFYYIEYGIAQLGALGMWQQFRRDPEGTLDRYTEALSLGGTRTLPELYQTAGIRFDFSANNVQALSNFVQEELRSLQH